MTESLTLSNLSIIILSVGAILTKYRLDHLRERVEALERKMEDLLALGKDA